MAAIRDDVVASVGTRYADQRFGSVVGTVAAQQLCRELLGGVGLGGPMSRG